MIKIITTDIDFQHKLDIYNKVKYELSNLSERIIK